MYYEQSILNSPKKLIISEAPVYALLKLPGTF